MKLFKMKQSKDISVIQGGYSDFRLWPCYTVYSASILFFSPFIGMTLSVLTFTAIGISIALYAAKRSPVISYDVESWRKDLNLAIEQNLTIPEIANYQVVTPAKVKTPKTRKIVTKKRSLWPYLDIPAKFVRSTSA